LNSFRQLGVFKVPAFDSPQAPRRAPLANSNID